MDGNGLAFNERKRKDIIFLRFSIITASTAAYKPVSKVPIPVLNSLKKNQNPKYRDQDQFRLGCQ